MNEIFKRRSIRKYIDKQIAEESIELLVKAGMNAPSAHNAKPTRYLVVSDKEKLEYLAMINKYGKMIKDASHAIIVCAEESNQFWVQDASASTQNILLQATSLGIGSCWIGLYPNGVEHDIKNYFKIPTEIRAFSIISLGYSNVEMSENNFYDKTKIHFNEWRN